MAQRDLVVEQKHADAAVRAGACTVPAVGSKASEYSMDALAWFEDNCPSLAKEAGAEIGAPLWTVSGYGSGSGSGYGYGYGSGSGFGYGYGSGSGFGYGSGSGDGSGSGFGYGYGSGFGYGYGERNH